MQILSGQNRGPKCGAVLAFMVSGLRLNCCLLIFSASSNAADRHGRRLESLEPEHRPDPLLYSPVILLDHVVQVFAGSHLYAARYRFNLFQFSDRPIRCGRATPGTCSMQSSEASSMETSSPPPQSGGPQDRSFQLRAMLWRRANRPGHVERLRPRETDRAAADHLMPCRTPPGVYPATIVQLEDEGAWRKTPNIDRCLPQNVVEQDHRAIRPDPRQFKISGLSGRSAHNCPLEAIHMIHRPACWSAVGAKVGCSIALLLV